MTVKKTFLYYFKHTFTLFWFWSFTSVFFFGINKKKFFENLGGWYKITNLPFSLALSPDSCWRVRSSEALNWVCRIVLESSLPLRSNLMVSLLIKFSDSTGLSGNMSLTTLEGLLPSSSLCSLTVLSLSVSILWRLSSDVKAVCYWLFKCVRLPMAFEVTIPALWYQLNSNLSARDHGLAGGPTRAVLPSERKDFRNSGSEERSYAKTS